MDYLGCQGWSINRYIASYTAALPSGRCDVLQFLLKNICDHLREQKECEYCLPSYHYKESTANILKKLHEETCMNGSEELIPVFKGVVSNSLVEFIPFLDSPIPQEPLQETVKPAEDLFSLLDLIHNLDLEKLSDKEMIHIAGKYHHIVDIIVSSKKKCNVDQIQRYGDLWGGCISKGIYYSILVNLARVRDFERFQAWVKVIEFSQFDEEESSDLLSEISSALRFGSTSETIFRYLEVLLTPEKGLKTKPEILIDLDVEFRKIFGGLCYGVSYETFYELIKKKITSS